MPVDEGKLRDALRPVFDKFDVDGSGSVSTDEMTRMVKQLKMDLSPEKIRKMMVEADPDMSGEVDFEEFCSAVKSQVEAGNGGALAELVQSAGGFFGFFGNLFSFMGGGAAEEPAKAAAPTPKGGGGGGGGGSAVPSARAMSAAPAPPPPAASSFFSSDPVVKASSPPQGGGLGSSLFDKYMSPSEARANRRLGHNETRTTRLRATGVKLSVYLNTEVNRGYATVISLPEECDTLGEVMPMIQKSMQLDRRMLYAAELYLPDGKKIMSYKELIDAAALDTAIVVGCGEPFDPSSIPYDILEFHLQGGGRQAANKVKKQLQSKRKDEALEKADTVRASGPRPRLARRDHLARAAPGGQPRAGQHAAAGVHGAAHVPRGAEQVADGPRAPQQPAAQDGAGRGAREARGVRARPARDARRPAADGQGARRRAQGAGADADQEHARQGQERLRVEHLLQKVKEARQHRAVGLHQGRQDLREAARGRHHPRPRAGREEGGRHAARGDDARTSRWRRSCDRGPVADDTM